MLFRSLVSGAGDEASASDGATTDKTHRVTHFVGVKGAGLEPAVTEMRIHYGGTRVVAGPLDHRELVDLVAVSRASETFVQPSDISAQDWLSHDAVALDGDTMVVGSWKQSSARGAAYVYEKREGSWSQTAKLLASLAPGDIAARVNIGISGAWGSWHFNHQSTDGDGNDVYTLSKLGLYGYTVAHNIKYERATGNWVAGGSAAYKFVRDGDTLKMELPASDMPGSWTGDVFLGNLIDPYTTSGSDASGDDYFGATVAVHGNTIAVGSPRSGDGWKGVAYVFAKNANGTWAVVDKLSYSETPTNDMFAWKGLSLHEDTLVVGAHAHGEPDVGAAFVFLRDAAGKWPLNQTITTGGEHTGKKVLVRDDELFVRDNAAVHVYTRSAFGQPWTAQTSIAKPADASAHNWVESMAYDAGVLVLGDPGVTSSTGTAYVYEKTGDTFAQRAELVGLSPPIGFQTDIPVSGGLWDTLSIVSIGPDADGNEVFARSSDPDYAGYFIKYNKSAREWEKTGTTTIPDTITRDGFRILLYWDNPDGPRYLVGEFNDPYSAAPNGVANDYFGHAVAVSGSTILVGAPGRDTGGAGKGAAYAFERDAGASTWSMTRVMSPDTMTTGSSYGNALAMNDRHIAAGAFTHDGFKGAVVIESTASTRAGSDLATMFDGLIEFHPTTALVFDASPSNALLFYVQLPKNVLPLTTELWTRGLTSPSLVFATDLDAATKKYEYLVVAATGVGLFTSLDVYELYLSFEDSTHLGAGSTALLDTSEGDVFRQKSGDTFTVQNHYYRGYTAHGGTASSWGVAMDNLFDGNAAWYAPNPVNGPWYFTSPVDRTKPIALFYIKLAEPKRPVGGKLYSKSLHAQWDRPMIFGTNTRPSSEVTETAASTAS